MTVALTGSAKEYAASLTRTASLPQAARRFIAAPGVLSVPVLRTRIVRILGYRRLESKIRSAGTVTTAAATIFGLAIGIGGLRLVGIVVQASTESFVELNPGAASVEQPAARVTNLRKPPRPRAAHLPRQQPVANSTVMPVGGDNQQFDQPEAVSIRRESTATEPVSPTIASSTPTLGSPVQPLTSDAMPAVNAVSLGTPPPPTTTPSSAPTPWEIAADAGVSVGRASQKAAVATAGFFSRLGKKIAGSFENPR
jgi:hypothetical protein